MLASLRGRVRASSHLQALSPVTPVSTLQAATATGPAWVSPCCCCCFSLCLRATFSCCCRSPQLWDRPDEFDPDRFGPLEGPAPNEVTEDFKYLPFGGGKRKCIGEGAATLPLQHLMYNPPLVGMW